MKTHELDEQPVTKSRGTLRDQYQCYLAHADDGDGNDITTGQPLKPFDEWLSS